MSCILVLRKGLHFITFSDRNRGYNQKKITENIECEILQVVLDEATESYKPEIVLVLQSNNIEEMDANMQKLLQWVNQWKASH